MTTPLNDDELSTLIRRQATRYKASSRLRTDIEARVVLAKANPKPDAGSNARSWARQQPGSWLRAAGLRGLFAYWRPVSLGMVCGVPMTLAAVLLVNQLRLNENPVHQMVAAHVQALRTGPLFVVASSDRHTVKPWFAGKLNFAPPVPDLSAAGFVLLGGRIDPLGNEQAAVVVYTHNKHTITIFVRPGTQAKDAVAVTDNGFHVLSWSAGGMKISMVSDMDAAEVEAFKAAWLKSL